ncbi:hypothetical protein AB3X94_37225 [Paraburkholderia sp. BR10923]
MRGLCSLNELRTVYSLDDVMDFHEAADAWDKAIAEAQALPRQQPLRRVR